MSDIFYDMFSRFIFLMFWWDLPMHTILGHMKWKIIIYKYTY